MAKTAVFSTQLDVDLKKAITLYCKRKGLKIQSVVEHALREQLEDEIDLAIYLERKDEEEIPFSEVLKKLKIKL